MRCLLAGAALRAAIAAFIGILGWGAIAPADPPQYELLVLEVPDYAVNVVPWGMNDKAQIVGSYGASVEKPFLWDRGQFIPLELPPDYAQARCEEINNAGQIVGTMGYYTAPARGFLYDGGQMIDLGTLEGGNFSEARAINDKGQITGYWGDNVDADPPIQAFLWEDGVMTNLGPDFPETSSVANDISECSQITGDTWTTYQTEDLAYIWEAGEIIVLGPIPGGFTSEPQAINLHGDVTGRGILYDHDIHAFRFHDGAMSDLGTLPGDSDSHAWDINDTQQVVGLSDNYPHDPYHSAFLWQEGVMYLIDDLVPPEADATLSYACAINNAGQITARGSVAGESAALLLTPVNPRPADVNWDGVVNIDDLFAILGGWGPCPDPPQVCPADVNHDGTVNIDDIFAIITDWG